MPMKKFNNYHYIVFSVVDFNLISTNPAGFQPKKIYFGLQPNGYNPSSFNPAKYFGLQPVGFEMG
jgi:hypothetical protein